MSGVKGTNAVVLDLYALIGSNPTLGFLLIVGFGYLIGELKILGFQFGSSTGVLLVALLFGHLGFKPPKQTESVGFMLFIYCVGLQAGPQFFSAFREQGAKFVALAFVTAALSFSLTLVLASVFDFAPGYAAGLLAGALTSTPALGILTKQAGNSLPVIGDAGTYTFANVILAFAGSLMMRL